MHGPAQFTELDFDLLKRCGQRAAPVRTAGALGQNAFTLQLKLMTPALALGLFLVRLMVLRLLSGGLGGCGLGLLLFYGLAFPTLRHDSIVRNRRDTHGSGVEYLFEARFLRNQYGRLPD